MPKDSDSSLQDKPSDQDSQSKSRSESFSDSQSQSGDNSSNNFSADSDEDSAERALRKQNKKSSLHRVLPQNPNNRKKKQEQGQQSSQAQAGQKQTLKKAQSIKQNQKSQQNFHQNEDSNNQKNQKYQEKYDQDKLQDNDETKSDSSVSSDDSFKTQETKTSVFSYDMSMDLFECLPEGVPSTIEGYREYSKNIQFFQAPQNYSYQGGQYNNSSSSKRMPQLFYIGKQIYGNEKDFKKRYDDMERNPSEFFNFGFNIEDYQRYVTMHYVMRVTRQIIQDSINKSKQNQPKQLTAQDALRFYNSHLGTK